MAKGSEGFCRFGAENLRGRLETLSEQIEGAKEAEDVEYVHQSRVASRRIRAAMPIFQECFSRRDFKTWRKQIKKVTGSLGDARDLDVQIMFLEDYLKEEDDQGVRRMLSSHRERRDAVQPAVAASVDDILGSGVIEEMMSACEELLEADVDAGEMMRQTRNRAYRHIHQRLEELLELERHVHDESAKERHHEMRIAAKRLRYTMETFHPSYEEGLKAQISEMKTLQDLLGDMHDCDVWLDYLPTFMADLGGEEGMDTAEEAGLERFRDHVSRTRGMLYRQFVEHWDGMGDTFADLRAVIRDGLEGVPLRDLLEMVEGDRPPRLALISDVHGNRDALEAVMRDARESGVEGFLNAGDLLGLAPFNEAVVERLCGDGVINVVGNYDLEMLSGDLDGGMAADIKRTVLRDLSEKGRERVGSLPREERLEIGGRRVLLTHGSPASIDEHIYATTDEARLEELARMAEADVVIVGHSHEQFTRDAGGVLFVNPGSVGRPGGGDPRAEYAIMGFDPPEVEHHKVDYDLEPTVERVRRMGLPEELAQMFLRGTSLKETVASLPMKGEEGEEARREEVERVREVARAYEWDMSHPEQVRRLALSLFDQLAEVHGMGLRERHWLECAALLHDIGWSQGWNGHNKASMRLILNDQGLPFDIRERYIVASLARYHRKGFPSTKHYNYSALSPVDRARVDALASLLRVADGLDYSHGAVVGEVVVETGSKKVTVRCLADGPNDPEDRSANKKKDLFEQVFQRELRIAWEKTDRSPSST